MKKEWGIKDILIALLGEGLLFGALILSVVIRDSKPLVIYPMEVRNIFMGILYISFAICGLLVICEGLLKINFRDCRILPIRIKTLWVIIAFIMPLLVSGILLCFPGKWLNIEFSLSDTITTLSFSLMFFGISAPIVEEMIFRGMMLTVFEKKWNKGIAIMLSSLLFGAGHLIGQKMGIRDFLLMTLSAGLIGAILAIVTFITESIWSSVIIHMVWNIIIMGQIVSIGGVRPLYSRYNYTFNSDSVLLTGGTFGIESSLPAIVVNIIFLIIVWKLWRKKVNILEAKTKYQDLIKNSNFDETNNFNDNLIPERIILSQSGDDEYSFYLTQKQYEALIKTMKQFGEKCFYIYLSEGYKNNEFILTEEDSLISLNKNISYEEYNNLEILLENVIYSSKKKWAIILTMENYGILAATEEFMTEYKKNYSNWKEDIEKFKYYFDAPNFNLTVVERIFNYVTENADDLTIEEKILPWKKK